MIDDERKWMDECDRRTNELNERLDDAYEFRDTEPFKKSDDEGEKDE